MPSLKKSLIVEQFQGNYLKCAIMQPKVEYFAFVLDREGIPPSQTKFQPVLEVCKPENRAEL